MCKYVVQWEVSEEEHVVNYSSLKASGSQNDSSARNFVFVSFLPATVSLLSGKRYKEKELKSSLFSYDTGL